MASYHADGEGADVVHVFEAELPRDEALDVDVELIPDAHDGFIILLVPRGSTRPLICRRETIFIKIFRLRSLFWYKMIF